MNYKVLRWARVAVSLIFLVLISLFFIDYRHFLPEKLISGVLYLQFIPSLMKFVQVLSVSALGFAVILVLTAFFGRIYCSSFCPLGTLQDVISSLSVKLKRRNKRRFRYSRPYTIIRYGLLALTAALLIAGSSFLVNLLDPYSGFGRIFTYLVKPLVVEINNLVAHILEARRIYSVFRVDLAGIRWEVLLVPVIILIVVLWFSFRRGRLFCNTVCPVGSLLGLLSRVSVFKIRIDESRCTRCGLCIRRCKSECIDIKNALVDMSRCVDCYNCLVSCPESAMKYDTRAGILSVRAGRPVTNNTATGTVGAEADMDKRKFIFGSLAFFLGAIGISLAQKTPVPKKASTVPEKKKFPVSPPGSRSISTFNDACTGCALCVSVCPTQVLQPSFLEYGLAGFMQPRMDYHTNKCTYDCVRCLEVCPTGALLPVPLAEKKTIQLGRSIFIKDNCIVHTEKTDCGACSEACPTKAVYMVPYEGTLVIPEVNIEICTGCGACEYACPTTPYKAIYVDGNPVHRVARLPEEQVKSKIDLEEEFPF